MDYNDMYVAFRQHDTDAVRALLSAGFDSNRTGHDGVPILHEAVDTGVAEIVELFLRHGANVDAPNSKAVTALMLAASSEHLPVCELLVAKGAALGARDALGNTALHYAAQQNQGSTCAFLIDRGADIDAEGDRACTPLHMAAEEGSASACEVLIARGANLYALDLLSEIPFHGACWRDDVDICELMVEAGVDPAYLNPDANPEHDLTPTQRAAKQGAVRVVKYLLTTCKQDPLQRTLAGDSLAEIAGNDAVRGLILAIATESALSAVLESPSAPAARRSASLSL